jgi:hypothetical protein
VLFTEFDLDVPAIGIRTYQISFVGQLTAETRRIEGVFMRAGRGDTVVDINLDQLAA